MTIPENHPLLLPNLKAQYTDAPYLRSSIREVEGFGTLSAKPRPFNARNAIKEFGAWAYKAGMLNASGVARLPLRMFVRTRSGAQKLFATRPLTRGRKQYLAGDAQHKPSAAVSAKAVEFGELEEVVEPHPALILLKTVNPWMNGFELTLLRLLYLQFTGNAYLHPVVNRKLGVPDELWVMPSQWTEVIPSRENFIDGYAYGQLKADQRKFAPDEVIHWKLPNMEDLHYGKGYAEAAWDALGLRRAKRIKDTAFYDNMARPDWLLIVKQGGSADMLDRFETAVEQKLRGPRNSGKFLTITGDVSAQALNLETEEVGDSQRIIEEIAAAFQCPVSKLLGNDPVKANADLSDQSWLRDGIAPLCRLDEEVLNQRYLPLFDVGEDALLAYDNPVGEDKEYELKKIEVYVGGPIQTPNEARAELGMDDIEGGDELVKPKPLPSVAPAKPGRLSVRSPL